MYRRPRLRCSPAFPYIEEDPRSNVPLSCYAIGDGTVHRRRRRGPLGEYAGGNHTLPGGRARRRRASWSPRPPPTRKGKAARILPKSPPSSRRCPLRRGGAPKGRGPVRTTSGEESRRRHPPPQRRRGGRGGIAAEASLRPSPPEPSPAEAASTSGDGERTTDSPPTMPSGRRPRGRKTVRCRRLSDPMGPPAYGSVHGAAPFNSDPSAPPTLESARRAEGQGGREAPRPAGGAAPLAGVLGGAAGPQRKPRPGRLRHHAPPFGGTFRWPVPQAEGRGSTPTPSVGRSGARGVPLLRRGDGSFQAYPAERYALANRILERTWRESWGPWTVVWAVSLATPDLCARSLTAARRIRRCLDLGGGVTRSCWS